MHRKDREMNEEFGFYVIDKTVFAVLATVNADGTPYCTQISHVREGRFIYFHGAKYGQKVDNMKINPHVCLSFTGYAHAYKDQLASEYESATVFGTAEEVNDEEEKKRVLYLITQKHTPKAISLLDASIQKSLSATAVYKISIDTLTAKRKKYDSFGKEMTFGRTE